MQFLSEHVTNVLDDLGVPAEGVAATEVSLVVELSSKMASRDLAENIRKDPRYASKLQPHPAGFYLYFENVNLPRQKSLATYAIDFRTSRGFVTSIRAQVKKVRLFSWSGEALDFFSSRSFLKGLEIERNSRMADVEAEALA